MTKKIRLHAPFGDLGCQRPGPRAAVSDNFPEIYEKWRKKEITASAAAALCGVSRNTFFRFVREYGQKNDH